MKNILFLLSVLFCLMSCSDDNDHSAQQPEEPQKTISDYQGVWENIKNDTAFVVISPTGFVSYYFSDKVMGQGQGKLEKNKILVRNEQTGWQDEITINANDNVSQIEGYVSSRANNGVYYIQRGTFKKTDESVVSFAGDLWIPDLWFGSSASYTWSQWRIQVTSNNSALHFKFHRTDGITKQVGLYCIQRWYKNRTKFLYARFSEKKDDNVVIFSFNPDAETKIIRCNKVLNYL